MRARRRSSNSSSTLSCTSRRDPAQQTCPWLSQTPSTTPSTAASRSAVSKTTNGDLPPSSSDRCLPVPAVARRISRPTSVEPVKAILATSGWRTSAAPVAPSPVTMLSTPGGSPVSSATSAKSRGGERRVLGGLEDHRVPGGQGGRDLPGQHEEGEVPRDDLADHANGLAVRELVVDQLRPAGVMVEVPRRQRDVEIARLADGLAVVQGLHDREQAGALLDLAGEAVEVARAGVAADLLPTGQRGVGRGDRAVHVVVGALAEAGERAPVGRAAGPVHRAPTVGPASRDVVAEGALSSAKPLVGDGGALGGGAVVGPERRRRGRCSRVQPTGWRWKAE